MLFRSVQQHQVRSLAGKCFSRRFGRICLRDPVVGLQRSPQPVSCRGFVIHDQNGLHHSLFLTSLLRCFLVSSIGSVTWNRVPRPFRTGLSQSTLPPNSATRRATIARPSPVPCDFVVKKGWRIFSRSAAGIPGPLSSTASVQTPSFEAADTDRKSVV